MDNVNKAFYEMIKNMWKALKSYNQGGEIDTIVALRRIHQQLEHLINAIKDERNSKNK